MTLAASVQVGVDIECLIPERYEPGMEDLVLTSNEKAALAAIDPADRWRAFLCGWTRKEAYAKCIGLGLSADLTNVELGLTEESIQVEGIVVTSFVPQQGFLAAWAAESALSPSFWNWTP
jgi:4'-phosphopantetheinyl transferase